MNETICERCRILISGYLDDELEPSHRAEVEQHTKECAECRAVLSAKELLLNKLHRQPAMLAPPELRQRVDSMLSNRTPPAFGLRHFLAVAAVIVVSLLGLQIWRIQSSEDRQKQRMSEFRSLAVETHLKRLNHQLPLEVISSSPETVSEWFNGKVNFRLELPSYPEGSGHLKKYSLEGARLVDFNGESGAGVSYRMEGQLITLVVLPSSQVTPVGGDEIISGKLTFHLLDDRGFHVISWTDHGLTYALVSNLAERGERSCMVCHHQNAEQNLSSRLQ